MPGGALPRALMPGGGATAAGGAPGGAVCCTAHLWPPRRMERSLLGDDVCREAGTAAAATDTVPVTVGMTRATVAPAGPGTDTAVVAVEVSAHPAPSAKLLYDAVGGRSMVGRLVPGLTGTSVCVVPRRAGSSIHVMPADPGRLPAAAAAAAAATRPMVVAPDAKCTLPCVCDSGAGAAPVGSGGWGCGVGGMGGLRRVQH